MERTRVEDLGRISEMLHALLNHEIFEESSEIVSARYIILLESFHHKLQEAWLVARFGDEEENAG